MKSRQINLFCGISILLAAAVWNLLSTCPADGETGKTVTYKYSGDVTTADRKSGVTTLEGHAWFRRSDGDYLNADKITMYKDVKTGEIVRIEAVGNVEMKEKEMSANCGHAVFYEIEERIELKGSVDAPAVVDDGENRMEAPFIIYFRKEDRIYASGLLFSVGLEAKSDLENGTIPEGLRQEFKSNRILLSDSVAVSTEETDARWLITDGDKKYTVRKEADKLNILASGGVQGHVTVEVKEKEAPSEESEQKKQSD